MKRDELQEWGRRGEYDRENSTDEVKIFKEHENSQSHLFVFVNKVIKPEKVNPYNVISYLRTIQIHLAKGYSV